MSIEDIKAVAHRWNEEIYSKMNLSAIDELYASDFVWHSAFPGMTPDREGYRQSIMSLLPFANIHYVGEDMITEGDKVAIRWTWSGTHKDEYMGIAPTGKTATITGITILRIVSGKIVEEWDEQDMLSFMEQLGIKQG